MGGGTLNSHEQRSPASALKMNKVFFLRCFLQPLSRE